MDVMFTTHPEDGPGDYYLVVAEAGEWGQILQDLTACDPQSRATEDMIKGLEGWGIV